MCPGSPRRGPTTSSSRSTRTRRPSGSASARTERASSGLRTMPAPAFSAGGEGPGNRSPKTSPRRALRPRPAPAVRSLRPPRPKGAALAPCEFTLKVAGDVAVLGVRGDLDSGAAVHLIETATAAAGVCRVVRIDLHCVESMTQEAAAVLLFRGPGDSLPPNIVLQANGQPGRQAVLQAFACHRVDLPAT